MKSQDTSELFFDNVRVPKSNLLGQKNAGFIYLMQELAQERLSVAIIGAAVAKACYDETVKYVKERKAFGKPIAAFQNTRFKLAEIRTELAVTHQEDRIVLHQVLYTVGGLAQPRRGRLDKEQARHCDHGLGEGFPVARLRRTRDETAERDRHHEVEIGHLGQRAQPVEADQHHHPDDGGNCQQHAAGDDIGPGSIEDHAALTHG